MKILQVNLAAAGCTGPMDLWPATPPVIPSLKSDQEFGHCPGVVTPVPSLPVGDVMLQTGRQGVLLSLRPVMMLNRLVMHCCDCSTTNSDGFQTRGRFVRRKVRRLTYGHWPTSLSHCPPTGPVTILGLMSTMRATVSCVVVGLISLL